MRILDKGTVSPSNMHFNMASDFAKKALFYMINSGTFYCTEQYRVTRDYLNSYLFMYIKKGKMKVRYKNKEFTAEKGSFVFINCHESHTYKAVEETIFEWFHFAGNSSKAYFNLLFEKYGCVYSLHNESIPNYMNLILKMVEDERVDEHKISIYIHHILYELNQVSMISDQSTELKVEQAIHFIMNHFRKDIKLEDIANHVYLSPYYFTRIFKKHMNSTPINYLIEYRINNAKKLLHHTTLSVKEIAEACGFNSTTHFITTFNKHVGMSPKKFREIQF